MAALRRIIGGGSVLALMLMGTAMVGTAAAVSPGCGSTISSNTTLTADVGPCNDGDGLVVTRSNITLNLGGHRVFSNAPLPRSAGLQPDPLDPTNSVFIPADVVGVHVLNARNVTVLNGTVQGFSAGIAIEGGGSNTVRGVTAKNNEAPCIGEDFSTQSLGKYGDGIVVFSSTNNRITNDTVLNNGPFSGISVVTNTFLVNQPDPSQPLPTGNLISANTVNDNNQCFGEIGIRIEGPGASRNTVSQNTVNRSFLEGIAVLSVNNINFAPLFADPPQCQNRGFPDPDLPRCPLLPNQPSNNFNVIQGNRVDHNGFGGPQTLAGPPPGGVNDPAIQERAGIQLLSFCGYGTVNGHDETVAGNTATNSAGDGIAVGGCAPTDTNPVGFVHNLIANNTAVNSNQAHCPHGPPAPCGPRFDLHDTNPNCDANTWSGNTYRTASPPCATVGGHPVPGASVVAAPATTAAASTAAEGQSRGPRIARRGRYIG